MNFWAMFLHDINGLDAGTLSPHAQRGCQAKLLEAVWGLVDWKIGIRISFQDGGVWVKKLFSLEGSDCFPV